MKIAELVHLNDNVRFLSLKPRLLKNTLLRMESLSASQRNDVSSKVRHLPLARMRRDNPDEDTKP
jgi:hypothetical protein